MNFLYIAPISIHPNASAGAETINTYIDKMSSFGHHIIVLALNDGRYHNKNITYIHINKETRIETKMYKLRKAIGWIFYPKSKYLYKTSPSLRKNIFTKLNKLRESGYSPDCIFYETTSAILLIDDIKAIYPNSIHIASLHDMAFQGSERRLNIEKNPVKRIIRKRYIKYAKTREIQALASTDIIMPHNSGNAAILRKFKLLENSVMFNLVPYYSNDYNHDDFTESKDILFYGLMNRPENYLSAQWFIDNVIPFLPSKYRFIVMGGNPPELIKKYSDSKVIVTGFVSEEEVRMYFENSFCMVVPLLFGSGIKTKVLSAMACGLPVLSNDIGIEGIEVLSGKDYLHCETPQDYINALCELDNNKEKYLNICENSKMFMNENYNINKCAEELNKKIYNLQNKSTI